MIQCLECGRRLTIITDSHCQAKHQMSLIQYRMKYPGIPTRSREYLNSLSRGQEERFNPGEAEARRVEKQDEAIRLSREKYLAEEAQNA